MTKENLQKELDKAKKKAATWEAKCYMIHEMLEDGRTKYHKNSVLNLAELHAITIRIMCGDKVSEVVI